VFKI
jgi:hypothetical protein